MISQAAGKYSWKNTMMSCTASPMTGGRWPWLLMLRAKRLGNLLSKNLIKNFTVVKWFSTIAQGKKLGRIDGFDVET